jgi:beta-N-acetylhexosaminidase
MSVPEPERESPLPSRPSLPRETPPSGAEERLKLVDELLAGMTLEQLVGQRFVTFLDGPEITSEEDRLVRRGLVGGFIIYPQNVVDRDQVADLTSELQRTAASGSPGVGLLLAADQEGGRVAALRLSDMPRFPAARSWARHEDEAYVEAASYVVNRELRSVGINMNFAPVLDVYEHADDSIIGDRAFAADPELVGRLGRAYLRGADRAGVIAVPKHFPGHGSTAVDSHGRLPVVALPAEKIYGRHLQPFRAAVASGAEAIMTAHLLFPALDPAHPVTLSRPIIEGLLREELGFTGVVISDGVAMGAISQNYSIAEAIELSIDAGIDIILVHTRYDVSELVETTVELVEAGRISQDRVIEGTRRVLELKARHGLLAYPSDDGMLHR